METATILYLIVIWYFIGVGSFIFWRTREYVILDKSDYFIMFLCGFTGLVSWFAGYFIHGRSIGYNVWGIRN